MTTGRTKKQTIEKEIPEEEIQETFNLENSGNAIDILLNLNGDALHVEKSVRIRRLGINWKVRALTFDEFEEIADRSVRITRPIVGTRPRRTVDDKLTNMLMVYYGSVDPSLKDARLFEKYKVNNTDPCELVKKVLLPGEIATIAGTISGLSGFDDVFSRLVEAAGNLSE